MGRPLTAGYGPDLIAAARSAFGHGMLPAPTRTARVANPLCGDDVELDLEDDGEQLTAVAHRTRGCSFTLASAALLAQTVRGRTMDDARRLARDLRDALATGAPPPGELALLDGVRPYPARLRCALLPWDALLTALGDA